MWKYIYLIDIILAKFNFELVVNSNIYENNNFINRISSINELPMYLFYFNIILVTLIKLIINLYRSIIYLIPKKKHQRYPNSKI
jgi:hypothetical protein